MANGEKGDGMSCGMCGHHHWSHWVIKALILLFVFWAGMEFGELRGLVRAYSSYGSPMMSGDYYGMQSMRRTGMMDGYGGDTTLAPAPTAAPGADASATPGAQ